MCNFNKIFSMTFLSILISFISCLPIINKTSSTPPLLLLISFDGFRWDYPDLYKLSNFNSLIKRGVRVKYIENNFATVTFPLHFTIVTGLYEETHGVVGNTMYDPILNATTTIDTMTDTKWWYVLNRSLYLNMNLIVDRRLELGGYIYPELIVKKSIGKRNVI